MPTDTDESAEKIKQRTELGDQILALNVELMTIADTLREPGVPRDDRRAMEDRRRLLARQKIGLEGTLRKVKQWLRDQCIPLKEKKYRPRPGMLDEFDLSNALSEPQGLLRHCHVAIKRLASRQGYQNGEMALLETLEDYFRRHGMQV